jgi:hypothetical protein
VHERNSTRGGGDRQIARAKRIDRVCLVAARVCTVDVVERAGVDHQRGTMERHCVAHGVELRDIEGRMA